MFSSRTADLPILKVVKRSLSNNPLSILSLAVGIILMLGGGLLATFHASGIGYVAESLLAFAFGATISAGVLALAASDRRALLTVGVTRSPLHFGPTDTFVGHRDIAHRDRVHVPSWHEPTRALASSSISVGR